MINIQYFYLYFSETESYYQLKTSLVIRYIYSSENDNKYLNTIEILSKLSDQQHEIAKKATDIQVFIDTKDIISTESLLDISDMKSVKTVSSGKILSLA